MIPYVPYIPVAGSQQAISTYDGPVLVPFLIFMSCVLWVVWAVCTVVCWMVDIESTNRTLVELVIAQYRFLRRLTKRVY